MKRAAALLVPALAALVFGLAISCAGCPTRPPSGPDGGAPETYDGSDVCAHVCDHLVALGCKSESEREGCTSTCRDGTTRRLTDFHTDCLLDAGTKETARACGPVRCP